MGTRKPVDVLAETAGRQLIYGPQAYELADQQVAALKDAGFAILPRIELARMLGHVKGNLGRDPKRDDLFARRGRRIIAELSQYLPPSEADDA